MLFLAIAPTLLWGQWRNNKPPKIDTVGVFQISGMIIGEASQQPVAYVQVQLNHSRHGTITSEEGFYSIPAGIDDTLYYTHLSYKPMRLIVRQYLAEYQGDKSSYIYIVNYMQEDTLRTRSVYILPILQQKVCVNNSGSHIFDKRLFIFCQFIYNSNFPISF